jgi:hypothetical protein
MNWKLTAGRLRDAWRAYPSQRNAFRTFPPGAPIFVTGAHRSGTTWAAKMLASPGLWYIHEPFNPVKRVWPEPFSYVNPEVTNPDVDRLMRRILRGGMREALNVDHADHPWMPLRRLPLRYGRLMIKDPLACLLTGYLSRHFGTRTLVLFRHPCGFVSSVLRLGWPTGSYLGDLLRRPQLMEDHLAPWAGLMEQSASEDSIRSAAVLHGVLNRVLWNQVQDQSLRYETFEGLCSDPIAKFQELFSWLELPYEGDVSKRHTRLCLSGSKSPDDYHPHAVARNSRAMAESWKSELVGTDRDDVRSVWEQFAIPLYRMDDDWDTGHSSNSAAPRKHAGKTSGDNNTEEASQHV